jgi:hypothetical protein
MKNKVNMPPDPTDPLRLSATATANGAASTDLDAKSSRKLDVFEQELARRAVAEEDLPPWD